MDVEPGATSQPCSSPRLREALNPGGVEVTRFGRTFGVVLCPVPFIS